jgi:hypothetical protein
MGRAVGPIHIQESWVQTSSWTGAALIGILNGFCSYIQQNVEILSEIANDAPFLPHAFKLIIHEAVYHSMLNNLSY